MRKLVSAVCTVILLLGFTVSAQVESPELVNCASEHGEIAYLSSGDSVESLNLYLMNSDGTSSRLLAENVESDFEWSPDGSKIVFTSFDIENTETSLNILDVDMGMITEITQTRFENIQPTWSPDGNYISYIANIDFSIHIMIFDVIAGENRQLTDSEVTYYIEDWSPDGKFIAVTISDGVGNQILMLDIETGEIIPITDAEDGIYDYFISWTPDSRYILFNSNRLSDNLQLHMVDINDESLNIVSDQIVNGVSWSNDGSWLIYMSGVETNNPNISIPNIFMMDWGSRDIIQITEDHTIWHENWFNPSLSPNQMLIAFEAWNEGDHDIYVVGVDGAGLQPILLNEADDTNPQWRPCQ